jgi:hypothetical protein
MKRRGKATGTAWAVEIKLTDGTSLLSGVSVQGRVGAVKVGTIITDENGRARFQISSPQKPPPLEITATWEGVKERRKIDWGNPYFTLTLRPSRWHRWTAFVRRHAPETTKGWIALAGVVLAAVYVVVCGLSWMVAGRDAFGYNARCARMAVERAARPAKPGLNPPPGQVVETVPISVDADVPQFLSQQVHVVLALERLRAAPAAGGELSAEARSFNEAWMNYERTVRDVAAKNEAPSAISCPLEEIKSLRKLFEAAAGKEDSK